MSREDATIENELLFDYRFTVNSSADAHYAQTLNDMMESAPNPTSLKCVQGDIADAPYSGEFKVRSSGNIELMECRFNSPAGSDTRFIGERTRSHISRNQSLGDSVIICLEGENQMNWNGRTHTMQAGDFFIMDTDTPFCMQSQNLTHGLGLALPQSWDRIGDIRLENIFGKLYPGRDRHHHGLVKYARHLLSRPNALNSHNVSDKLYDVIALALNPRATSEHKAGLLALVSNHINAHYPDSDLNPAKVAAAFNISVRYLHKLFEISHTSFTEYLVGQRLTQAHRILADPRYQHQTILSIAFDCGFRDINHFGRRFRACYGSTPSEIRRAASDSTSPASTAMQALIKSRHQ